MEIDSDHEQLVLEQTNQLHSTRSSNLHSEQRQQNHHSLVVPGQTISTEQGYLRGHGTYFEAQREDQGGGATGDDQGGSSVANHLVSSLAGVIERVNKLVSVRPITSRYTFLHYHC